MVPYFLSVYVHIVAACAWIGSMLFFAAVVVPSIRNPALASHAPLVTRILGRNYGRFGSVCLVVLVATGATNLWARGITFQQLGDPVFWSSNFGRALAHKIVLVLSVLVATVAHQAWMGTRALDILARDPSSKEAISLRKRASWIGRVTLLLSLAIVYYAVALVRGAP